MDILLIFMVFSSVTPWFFWRWGWQWLALLQLPFIMGMWGFLFEMITSNGTQPEAFSLLWFLFYGNFVLAELAVVLACRQWNQRTKSQETVDKEKAM
ncbi:spore morphogenesis/germination protein YwcE [Aneurinibacillus terranovensis]|uniref:spore morphogenesis/germination protein YwcE n=1 Tax=Aneurinibacillus terranovensis TaxID=278991 RepID=UPI00040D0D31|nr:spore morphogenesis/germination protein YwcE [Aneurinibacillus terranovensis]